MIVVLFRHFTLVFTIFKRKLSNTGLDFASMYDCYRVRDLQLLRYAVVVRGILNVTKNDENNH